MLGVSMMSYLLGYSLQTSSSSRIKICLEFLLIYSEQRQQISVLFSNGYLNNPLVQQPIYNAVYNPTPSFDLHLISFTIVLIIKMHLTISRKNQSQQHLNKYLQKEVILAPFSLQTRNTVPISNHKQNSSGARESASENAYCKHWIFSNCLKRSRQNSHLPSARQQKADCIDSGCSKQDNRAIRRPSKIKVMSCFAKNENRYEVHSQSLKKMKTLENYEEALSKFNLQKINEILQTKNCTIADPSPFISREISTNNKDQGATLRKSFNNKGQKLFTDKKLLLTISRQLKVSKKSEIFKFTHPSRQIKKMPQASEALIGPQSKIKEQSICTHLRMSSNQFKIIDPLCEIKSLDTQYLKNKIVFSEARTEKEGKTERQVIIDCLYEPIKIVDWTKEYEAMTPLSRKKNNQIYRSLAIRNITVANQHELTEVSKYSGESIVLEKGLADIFNLPPSNEHKASAQTKPRQSVGSSMIKYDTSSEDEEEQWYQIPLRNIQ